MYIVSSARIIGCDTMNADVIALADSLESAVDLAWQHNQQQPDMYICEYDVVPAQHNKLLTDKTEKFSTCTWGRKDEQAFRRGWLHVMLNGNPRNVEIKSAALSKTWIRS